MMKFDFCLYGNISSGSISRDKIMVVKLIWCIVSFDWLVICNYCLMDMIVISKIVIW